LVLCQGGVGRGICNPIGPIMCAWHGCSQQVLRLVPFSNAQKQCVKCAGCKDKHAHGYPQCLWRPHPTYSTHSCVGSWWQECRWLLKGAGQVLQKGGMVQCIAHQQHKLPTCCARCHSLHTNQGQLVQWSACCTGLWCSQVPLLLHSFLACLPVHILDCGLKHAASPDGDAPSSDRRVTGVFE
jgi:hypothetical protein